jgi:hypothetical protein
METKQTAVEWLFDKITQNEEIRWRGAQYRELFEQAKAMEKEHIIKFADEYADAVMGGCIKRAEQYYNETYNKQ